MFQISLDSQVKQMWCGPTPNANARFCELVDKLNAIIDGADSESRAMTEDEIAEYDGIMTEVKAMQALMGASEEIDTLRNSMVSRGRRTTPEGPTTSGIRRQFNDPLRRDSGDVLNAAERRRLQRQPFQGRHYHELFGKATDRAPFTNVDEFLSIIVNNQFDPRLVRAAAGMSEGVQTDGGYLVPVEYAAMMLDQALEQSVLFGRVRVEPMVSSQKRVGTFDNSDNSSSTPYGLTLEWKAERGTWTGSKAKTRVIILNAHKAGVYVPYTAELAEDSPNFSAQLQDAVSAAIGWGIDDAIITATGAGKPQGILNSNALISVAKETGQLAATFQFENVVKMYSRMHPGSIQNAIWLANPSTLPFLLSLAVPLGVGGEWTPALTNQAGVYMLLGRPLFLTEKCSALGTQGDILFVDPSQYVLGLRRDLTVALDPYSKFSSDEIVLKVTVRLDGQPAVGNTFTPKNGDTTSPFIALDTRA